jgi:hypothetical protein
MLAGMVSDVLAVSGLLWQADTKNESANMKRRNDGLLDGMRIFCFP